ncbi:uncharacterized protein I206_105110 [Kwoniella pini CBS 10737]|uniref:Uncharacterized protein n=1 Tax=Kwoniella pini CBS 10737 TaxID=1296096 RepID=A0A1B9I8V8_9TREE|nr:uncharacterized protein I206_02651 [Kwoniella pini CBS 10737]OCF51935.1 hypothetical protein I206_02651 [Kwoniella pini CBS 10737]
MEQADLVRALESIDHTDILAHHVNLPSTDHHTFQVDHQDQQHVSHNIIDNTNIQTSGQDEQAVLNDETELNTWSREQLQAEIVKLRRLTKLNNAISSVNPEIQNQHQDVQLALQVVSDASHDNPSTNSLDPVLRSTQSSSLIDPPSSELKEGRPKRKRNNENGSSVREKKVMKRHESTGKRLEKDRKTELAKAVRYKMRTYIGVGMEDPLPHPHQNKSEGGEDDPNNTLLFVPDWSTQLNNTVNSNWVDRISQEIYQEALAGLHPKIPNEDIIMDIIEMTTKTAFINMCKRYAQENDPKGVERRDRYTKKRRRWARKDLKQKRRTRAAADSAFQDLHLPPSALHIDYMSSEYSSSGENTDGETEEGLYKRKEQWNEMRKKQFEEDKPVVNGKGGWAVGISEKVLEVRTPRWRSETLNDIYRRLDAHATQFSDTRASGSSKTTPHLHKGSDAPNIRPGHVAPSHRRFTMEIGTMRKGGTPRDLGEGWMWASGMGGVWPEEAARWIGEGPFEVTVNQHINSQSADNGLTISSNNHSHLISAAGQAADTLEDVDMVVDGIEGGNELEAARLGLVNALEGL